LASLTGHVHQLVTSLPPIRSHFQFCTLRERNSMHISLGERLMHISPWNPRIVRLQYCQLAPLMNWNMLGEQQCGGPLLGHVDSARADRPSGPRREHGSLALSMRLRSLLKGGVVALGVAGAGIALINAEAFSFEAPLSFQAKGARVAWLEKVRCSPLFMRLLHSYSFKPKNRPILGSYARSGIGRLRLDRQGKAAGAAHLGLGSALRGLSSC
jgi:hypothetical protein